MTPYTAYWISTIGLIAICLIVGGAVGYAIGLRSGVNMFLVDDDDDQILDAQEVE